ncbi:MULTISPECIES: hypothetical protein [unclassified Pseudomonas]|uniref:hypothetical protein n=1 Tax=unclassified Pseudomonas TaxID=196821 RepID=UPI000A1EA02E|nr:MULTISPECIES: hypothetical protein [unclassified Pseudomonas]
MNSSALKVTDTDPLEVFTAILEDGSEFSATLTEIQSSNSPGRGDLWVVIATEFNGDAAKSFTIVFSKSIDQAIGKITENDVEGEVGLFFNDYSDPDHPTLQKARSGNIQYSLDPQTLHFIGTFNAHIDKADNSGHSFLSKGEFDTVLGH